MTIRRRVTQIREDGWMNAIKGFGDDSYDKRVAAEVILQLFPQETALEVWRGDAFAARIVEKPVKEMLRRGFRVMISGDKEATEATRSRLEELRIRKKLRRALEYERALGGGALLLGVDDGRSFTRPLDEERIRKFSYVSPLTPEELMPVRYYSDPMHEKFGEPEIFELRRASARARDRAVSADKVQIHESRLIIFPGLRLTKDQKSAHPGWGDSIFCRVWESLRDFVESHHSAAVLLGDFAQAVYKIKGLAELLANDDDETVRTRAKMVDYMRSVARAILVDSEEDFERKPTPVDGMPDLLDRLAQQLAAAVDMPVTLLLGRSPAGLNATGESNIRNWYDHVAGEQEDKLRDPLERLIRLLFLAPDGPTDGKEPEDWSLVFPALWEPTETEKSEIRMNIANADKAYVDAGILMPEEIATSRFGGDEWTMDTQLDQAVRDEYEEEEAAQAQLEAKALEAQLAAGGPPAAAGPRGAPAAKPGVPVPPRKA